MRFEWDQKKARRNREKHGVSFFLASMVFDACGYQFEDRRQVYGERRYVRIGEVEGKVIVVAFTMRRSNIRIISARNASRKEKQKFYEKEEENKK